MIHHYLPCSVQYIRSWNVCDLASSMTLYVLHACYSHPCLLDLLPYMYTHTVRCMLHQCGGPYFLLMLIAPFPVMCSIGWNLETTYLAWGWGWEGGGRWLSYSAMRPYQVLAIMPLCAALLRQLYRYLLPWHLLIRVLFSLSFYSLLRIFTAAISHHSVDNFFILSPLTFFPFSSLFPFTSPNFFLFLPASSTFLLSLHPPSFSFSLYRSSFSQYSPSLSLDPPPSLPNHPSFSPIIFLSPLPWSSFFISLYPSSFSTLIILPSRSSSLLRSFDSPSFSPLILFASLCLSSFRLSLSRPSFSPLIFLSFLALSSVSCFLLPFSSFPFSCIFLPSLPLSFLPSFLHLHISLFTSITSIFPPAPPPPLLGPYLLAETAPSPRTQSTLCWYKPRWA